MSDESKVGKAESDVDEEADFYDAEELDLEKIRLTTTTTTTTNESTNPKEETEKEKTEKEEIEKEILEVDHDDDDDDDDDEKFVPLHEKLNAELKSSENPENPEDEEEEGEDVTPKPIDPHFVDEKQKEIDEKDLTPEQLENLLKEAQNEKIAGNNLFKEEKFTEALESYTKALKICPLIFIKERSVFYSNRSICYHKMKENEKCIYDCSKSIELDDKFIKPLLRRAECLVTAEKLEEALEDYKRLAELEPTNRSHKQNIFQLEEKIKERNEKLKEEMMGKLKDLGNMILKPFGLSTTNFQFVQDPQTGSYSVNFKK